MRGTVDLQRIDVLKKPGKCHRTNPVRKAERVTAVDLMTDEEIEARVRDDVDAELLNAEWFRTAELIVSDLGKERITIRVDRDVVDYFRKDGPGYQSRMNAVLKAYVLSRRLKEQEEKP